MTAFMLAKDGYLSGSWRFTYLGIMDSGRNRWERPFNFIYQQHRSSPFHDCKSMGGGKIDAGDHNIADIILEEFVFSLPVTSDLEHYSLHTTPKLGV
jgi:hypothetical protein